MTAVVSDPILDKHIGLTVQEMLAQLDHASNYKTRAKTGYYKVAIILAASILEALLYHYIDRASSKDSSILRKVKSRNHFHTQDLGSVNKSIGTGQIFCMHEIKESDFELTNKTKLNDMIDFCYNTKLVGYRLKEGIKYVQDKRNKVHLQGLTTTSYIFNGQMLDRTLDTILKVYTKIEKL